MKSYEKESFKKSFLLFFTIQFFFFTLVMYQYQKSEVHKYDMQIMHQMRACSYTFECQNLKLDFVEDISTYKVNKFYEKSDYFMFFPIPTDSEHYLKVLLNKQSYDEQYQKIVIDIVIKYLVALFILVLISSSFARFSLRPLREALLVNDEFVKDMLHDFNTPLSSLKINFKILQKKFGKDEAILRSENAMQNIEALQSNLSSFLSHNPLTKEAFDVRKVVEDRIQSYRHLFPNIIFENHLESVWIESNINAFTRIVDNLLSNAAKYNKPEGFVKIFFVENELIIEDSGIGIKNPNKVFMRFYKETSRGLGIGLHVVEKLCSELELGLKVQSKVNVGSKFFINLEKVMFS